MGAAPLLPITRGISRDIWNFRRHFKIPMFNDEGSGYHSGFAAD
jgi:hypothetical protein